MGAELARKRAGKKTVTGMSEEQLRDFARKPKRKKKKGNPGHKMSWEDGLRKHMEKS